MNYNRMVIEKEAPEEYGYDRIRYNLSESSIADQKLSDIGLSLPDLTLFYGEHRGDKALRDLIAAQDAGISPDDVLVTAGAAGALFIISTSLLSAGDHLVVIRPNYATNIETPRAIGCAISFVDLAFDEGFAIDVERVKAAMRSNTKLISVTCPHNPTGTMMSRAELDALVALAKASDCHLLVDETYRDLSYGRRLPSAASLSKKAISVSSLSKAFGIPGIRIGWLTTRDAALQEKFLVAKEQIGICGSVIDEGIARGMLERRDAFLAKLLPEMASAVISSRPGSTASRWSTGCGPRAVSSASRASMSSPASTSTGSMSGCWKTTVPMSGPATGSRWKSASSVSASAGRRRPS
ncbi:pyridoxal phosphate-dependent aminotransferase [Mesorhizobium sp. SARCC-RB16n]|uniref:pyridoxal phosphate-dependent aminotransferase n=1 Tax=Mesorhizobium sp. SARCC-RB16n TaxID=2116687 RepID=UPI001FED94EC|nr:pyridoxal phosphate-dependent aminotransferase [Mesorhizobium sp. SARCC-RB16n]